MSAIHLELDGTMNLYKAHLVADVVEAEILAAFPEPEVIIHQDPSDDSDKGKVSGEPR